MGDSEELSRASIPDVEAIKPAALEALASGRARSLESFERETAKRLGLSSKQRTYCIGGSATALFSNRFEKARSELHHEGLIEYPTHGKVRLTEAGRSADGEKPAASAGDAPAIADEPARSRAASSLSRPRRSLPRSCGRGCRWRWPSSACCCVSRVRLRCWAWHAASGRSGCSCMIARARRTRVRSSSLHRGRRLRWVRARSCSAS